MPHPQEQELRNHLQAFLSDSPELLARRYRTLTVYEPDSGARIEHYYSDWEHAGAEDDEDVDIIEGLLPFRAFRGSRIF